MSKEKFPLKPVYTYAIMGVLILALVIVVIGNSITGFVAGSAGDSLMIETSEPADEPAPEPSCRQECGKPCWLVESGQDSGTFESAQGKIGISECNGKCYELKQSVGEKLCCSHRDCPSDAPVCSSEGKCTV